MTNTMGIDFAGDVGEFAADLPSVLTYESVAITGTRGAYTRTRDVEAAGILTPLDLPWIGKVADFTGSSGVPAEGVVVDIDGTNYHVVTTTVNEDQDVVRLEVRRS